VILSLKGMALTGAAAFIAGSILAGGTAWKAQEWRYGKQIADASAEIAKAELDEAKAHLQSVSERAERVGVAADLFVKHQTLLSRDFAALRREFKNAPPLPTDCRPDSVRVRRFEATINAANRSISGTINSSPVPPNTAPARQ
jgi:hypothetical protein